MNWLQFIQNILNSPSNFASSPFGLTPFTYNQSLFPLGLYGNTDTGQFATPYNQQYGAAGTTPDNSSMLGSGWYNALMPDQNTGQMHQLPSWANAANPIQATQMWADQQNQQVYGTKDQQQLAGLAGAGFPMFQNPSSMQDFAANTFGMTPNQFSQGYYGSSGSNQRDGTG